MLGMLLVKLNLEDKLSNPEHHRVVVCWLDAQALISKYRETELLAY